MKKWAAGRAKGEIRVQAGGRKVRVLLVLGTAAVLVVLLLAGQRGPASRPGAPAAVQNATPVGQPAAFRGAGQVGGTKVEAAAATPAAGASIAAPPAAGPAKLLQTGSQPASETTRAGKGAILVVQAAGQVLAVPDRADLSVGVVQRADTAAKAQAAAATAMDAVISALERQGVARKALQTQALEVFPLTRYDQKSGEDQVQGYQARIMLTVRLGGSDGPPLQAAGALLDAASAAGANQVQGLHFYLSDPAKWQESALEQAAALARRQAAALARNMGVRLGPLLEVRVLQVLGPGESPDAFAGPQLTGAAFKAESVAAGPAVLPGQIPVGASIEVRYGLQ